MFSRGSDSFFVSQAFDCSIRKDEHLAIAFFQRGITFYKKKRQDTPVFFLSFFFFKKGPYFFFMFNVVI